jgi:hypothetical protein
MVERPSLLATAIIMAPAPNCKLLQRKTNKFVTDRIADGADYNRIMVKEGAASYKVPGLPLLSNETLIAAVEEAHCHNKLAVAHGLAAEAAKQTIAAGLAHVWIDRPDSELVAAIARVRFIRVLDLWTFQLLDEVG